MARRISVHKKIDFYLAGLRHPLLRYTGAIQATALTTAVAHLALMWHGTDRRTIGHLIDAAEGDLRHSPPPRILTRAYTVADAESIADPTTGSASLSAALAAGLISKIDRFAESVLKNRRDMANQIIMRRLLGALLLTFDRSSLEDCLDSLSQTDLEDMEAMVLLTPETSRQESATICAIRDFWQRWDMSSWSKESYRSLVASAFLTASKRLGIEPYDIANEVKKSNFRTSFASGIWANLAESGLSDDLVSSAKDLADTLATLSMTALDGEVKILAEAAVAMAPDDPVSLVTEWMGNIADWEIGLPERLRRDQMALVIGRAPAVLI